MTVNEAISSLSLETLNLADGDRTIEGGYTGDLLSWVMGRAQYGNAWVTIMTNPNVIAVAVLLDLSCVIIAEDSDTDEALIKTAKEKGVNLLRSSKSSFTLCKELSSFI